MMTRLLRFEDACRALSLSGYWDGVKKLTANVQNAKVRKLYLKSAIWVYESRMGFDSVSYWED